MLCRIQYIESKMPKDDSKLRPGQGHSHERPFLNYGYDVGTDNISDTDVVFGHAHVIPDLVDHVEESAQLEVSDQARRGSHALAGAAFHSFFSPVNAGTNIGNHFYGK